MIWFYYILFNTYLICFQLLSYVGSSISEKIHRQMKDLSNPQLSSLIMGWKKAVCYKTCIRYKINYDRLMSLIQQRQENKKLAQQYPQEYCERLLLDLDDILCLTEWQKHIDYYGHGHVDDNHNQNKQPKSYIPQQFLTNPLGIKKLPSLTKKEKQQIKTFISLRTVKFCNANNPFVLTPGTFKQLSNELNSPVDAKVIYKYIDSICYCINKLSWGYIVWYDLIWFYIVLYGLIWFDIVSYDLISYYLIFLS